MMMAATLNPSGVNPYSTPIPHYTPSPSGSAPTSNHAPSPPPFASQHLGESQELSSSSPKGFSRDGGGSYVMGRTAPRLYNSFQHHHPAGPTYPPPPLPTSAPPTSSSRFSHFQSLGPSSLVQAEAALWGDQRRVGSNGGSMNDDKKSRGESLSRVDISIGLIILDPAWSCNCCSNFSFIFSSAFITKRKKKNFFGSLFCL